MIAEGRRRIDLLSRMHAAQAHSAHNAQLLHAYEKHIYAHARRQNDDYHCNQVHTLETGGCGLRQQEPDFRMQR